MPNRILVIDDDMRLQSVVRDFFEAYGHEVHTRLDGVHVREDVEAIKPDIILLDVMLPEYDGFAVLQNLRAVSRVPVIMLTARGDDADRIVGLELGADDYLPKPFNPRELLARIKAVLRRVQEREEGSGAGPGGASEGGVPSAIGVDGLTLDLNRQRLLRGDKSIDLSTTEFYIVRAFMTHAGEVLSREKILNLAFGNEHYGSDRNIDVYISRLRNILRGLGEDAGRIRTVWGSGYCWVRDSAATPRE